MNAQTYYGVLFAAIGALFFVYGFMEQQHKHRFGIITTICVAVTCAVLLVTGSVN